MKNGHKIILRGKHSTGNGWAGPGIGRRVHCAQPRWVGCFGLQAGAPAALTGAGLVTIKRSKCITRVHLDFTNTITGI
jgi:hypothetical protein